MQNFRKFKITFILLTILVIPLVLMLNYYSVHNGHRKFYMMTIGEGDLPIDIRFKVSGDQWNSLTFMLIKLDQSIRDFFKTDLSVQARDTSDLIKVQQLLEQLNTYNTENSQYELSKECQLQFDIDDCFQYTKALFSSLEKKPEEPTTVSINPKSLLLESYFIDSVNKVLKENQVESFFLQSEHILVSTGYNNKDTWEIVFNNKRYYIKNNIIFYSSKNVLILENRNKETLPFVSLFTELGLNKALIKNQLIEKWPLKELEDQLKVKPSFSF